MGSRCIEIDEGTLRLHLHLVLYHICHTTASMIATWCTFAITVLSLALSALALPTKPSSPSVTVDPRMNPTVMQKRDRVKLIEIQNVIPTRTEATLIKVDLGTSIAYTWTENGKAKTTVGPAAFEHPGSTVTKWMTTVVSTLTTTVKDEVAQETVSATMVTSAWAALPMGQQFRCNPDDNTQRDVCIAPNAAGNACASWTPQSCNGYRCATGRSDPALKEPQAVSGDYADCYPLSVHFHNLQL